MASRRYTHDFSQENPAIQKVGPGKRRTSKRILPKSWRNGCSGYRERPSYEDFETEADAEGSLVTKAIKGDAKAASIIIQLVAQAIGLSPQEDGKARLDDTDGAILSAWLARASDLPTAANRPRRSNATQSKSVPARPSGSTAEAGSCELCRQDLRDRHGRPALPSQLAFAGNRLSTRARAIRRDKAADHHDAAKITEVDLCLCCLPV